MVKALLKGAALVVLAAGLLPALAADEDILGPIGPLPAPRPDHRPARRMLAVSLAVGFGTLSVYLTMRRRRTRRRPAGPAAPQTAPAAGPDLPGLEDVEFYAELFRLARDASGQDATATPLECAGVPGKGEEWPGFCARVADVLYAGLHTEASQREADLRFVRDLTERAKESTDGF